MVGTSGVVYTWPILLEANIIINSDLNINSVRDYFMIGKNGITINGNTKGTKLAINVQNYPGLIYNKDYSNITVRKLYTDTSQA